MLGTFSFVLRTILILYEIFSCSEYHPPEHFVFFSEKNSILMEHLYFLPRIFFSWNVFIRSRKITIFNEIFFPQKYFCAQNIFLHLYLMAHLIGPFVLLSDGLTGLPICEQKGHICIVSPIIEHISKKHTEILFFYMLGTFFICSQNNSYFCMKFFPLFRILFPQNILFCSHGTSLFLTQNNFFHGMFLFVPEQLLFLTEIFFPQKYFCAQNNLLHLYAMAQLIGPFVLLSDGLTYL